MIGIADQRLRLALRLIGLGLFAWILTRIDIPAVLQVYGEADLGLALWVVLLFYPTIWLKSLRWRCLLPVSGEALSQMQLFRSYLAGYFAGTITPGRLGEFSRISYLRSHGVPVWESAFSILTDRALDIAALGFLALMGTIVLVEGWSTWIIAATMVTGCLTAVGWRWSLDRLRTILRHTLTREWAHRLHDAIDALVEGLANNRRVLLPSIGWTALSWGIFCIQTLLMGAALNIEVGAAQLVGACSLAAIVGALPITVAGVGTRDAALVITFGLAGLPAESAVAFSSAILLLYVLQGLLCVPFWLHVPARTGDTHTHTQATEA